MWSRVGLVWPDWFRPLFCPGSIVPLGTSLHNTKSTNPYLAVIMARVAQHCVSALPLGNQLLGSKRGFSEVWYGAPRLSADSSIRVVTTAIVMRTRTDCRRV
jgi:hypothetical protein